jgi:hypothetical protein
MRGGEREMQGGNRDREIDLDAVASDLRATVAGCVDSLSGISLNSGEELSNVPLTELLVGLADGDLTFVGFRKLVLQKMATESDPTELNRLATVLTAAATGEKPRSAEPRHTSGAPKVGVLERLLDAVVRRAKGTIQHRRPAEPGKIVRQDETGARYVEVKAGSEDLGASLGLYLMVLEDYRHVLALLGEATELQLHSFFAWHQKRVAYGDTLSAAAYVLRILIRLIDNGDADFRTAVQLYGATCLEDARQIFRGPPAPPPVQAAEMEELAAEKKAVGAPGSAKDRACGRWNTEDPDQPGAPLPCLYRKPGGQCRYAHKCSTCGKSGCAA